MTLDAHAHHLAVVVDLGLSRLQKVATLLSVLAVHEALSIEERLICSGAPDAIADTLALVCQASAAACGSAEIKKSIEAIMLGEAP